MKIFKFGGGIIKDIASLRTLVNILKEFNNEELLVVISAFDKTTNRLENLISDYYHNKKKFNESFEKIRSFHFSFINELGFNDRSLVFKELNFYFRDLLSRFEYYHDYPYEVLYDQTVSFGEIFSSCILHYFLLDAGFDSYFLDARKVIRTDHHHRSACILEEISRDRVLDELKEGFHKITVTQGFIGMQENGLTTTLGREGSDYSASVFGAILKANKVIIWKDVEGVFNADPKFYPSAVQIKSMSYDKAAELTGLGAKVLHSRTIEAVKNSNIPLEVRFFREKSCCGTLISSNSDSFPDIPVIVNRKNKILFLISSLINGKTDESDIYFIVSQCRKFNLEINYQSSANSMICLCLSQPIEPTLSLREVLEQKYKIEMVFGVTMVKIKNGNDEVFRTIKNGRRIIFEDSKEGINYLFY